MLSALSMRIEMRTGRVRSHLILHQMRGITLLSSMGVIGYSVAGGTVGLEEGVRARGI
jgi:hypothetical protein